MSSNGEHQGEAQYSDDDSDYKRDSVMSARHSKQFAQNQPSPNQEQKYQVQTKLGGQSSNHLNQRNQQNALKDQGGENDGKGDIKQGENPNIVSETISQVVTGEVITGEVPTNDIQDKAQNENEIIKEAEIDENIETEIKQNNEGLEKDEALAEKEEEEGGQGEKKHKLVFERDYVRENSQPEQRPEYPSYSGIDEELQYYKKKQEEQFQQMEETIEQAYHSEEKKQQQQDGGLKEVTTRIFTSPVEAQTLDSEIYKNFSAPVNMTNQVEEQKEEEKQQNEQKKISEKEQREEEKESDDEKEKEKEKESDEEKEEKEEKDQKAVELPDKIGLHTNISLEEKKVIEQKNEEPQNIQSISLSNLAIEKENIVEHEQEEKKEEKENRKEEEQHHMSEEKEKQKEEDKKQQVTDEKKQQISEENVESKPLLNEQNKDQNEQPEKTEKKKMEKLEQIESQNGVESVMEKKKIPNRTNQKPNGKESKTCECRVM